MLDLGIKTKLFASIIWLGVFAGFFFMVNSSYGGEKVLKYTAQKKIVCFERDDFVKLTKNLGSHLFAMGYTNSGNVVEFWQKLSSKSGEYVIAETAKDGKTCIPVVGSHLVFFGLAIEGEDM